MIYDKCTVHADADEDADAERTENNISPLVHRTGRYNY